MGEEESGEGTFGRYGDEKSKLKFGEGPGIVASISTVKLSKRTSDLTRRTMERCGILQLESVHVKVVDV